MNSASVLHKSLQLFDRDEYRMLCLALDVPYDNIVIPGGTIADAAGRLMAFCASRGLTSRLAQLVVSERHGHPLVNELQELFTWKSASSDTARDEPATREREAGDAPCEAAYFSCFISYASADTPFTSRLHADLRRAGVDCYYAPVAMRIGSVIRDALEDALGKYDKLLVIVSTASVQSAWVEKEIETAFERERQTRATIVFPVTIDEILDVKSTAAWANDIRRMRHVGDFRGWRDPVAYDIAFRSLLDDLRV